MKQRPKNNSIDKINIKNKTNPQKEKEKENQKEKLDFNTDENLSYLNTISMKGKKKRSLSHINFFQLEKKNQENSFFNKSERNFVDFMIQDQTKFANLENIEAYFKDQIQENLKNFDMRNTKINKRQQELDSLEREIEKELLNNAEIVYDNLIDEYNDIKNEIKENIKLKLYDYRSKDCMKNNLINEQVIK
jgi:hypothetical protein